MGARILAVEDNRVQAKILELQLKDHYEVLTVASGEECLAALASATFDIVLLDVNLPGMSGYEVCRHIKSAPATADIPVIFITVQCDMEDRLQGFEAGGFDYLAKPIVREELLKKLTILTEHSGEVQRLKSSADYAVSTAMTAMTSAAEQGLVLQFMKASFGCKNQLELAEAIMVATRQFGLDAMLQIRSQYGNLSRCSSGPCSPLEESVLGNVSGGGRIVDLRQRTAINYERVTLLLKNMPTDDPERYGRLKDHLNVLLEGADARIMALDVDAYLGAEARRLIDAVRSISVTLIEANRKTHELHASYGAVVNKLAGELETAIPLLELNRSQEAMLENLLHETSAAYVALAAQESEVDRDLLDAMESLQALAPRRTP